MDKAPDNQVPKPGEVLRTLRTQRGWTLADVSGRTGLSVSILSKVENGRMSLSYEKMIKIATGLGIDIGVLFAAPTRTSRPADLASPVGRRSITRAGEGREIATTTSHQLYPAADLLNKQLVPIIAEVKARSVEEFGKLLRHAGEEYVLVLEGAIELHTEFYEPVRLNTGDSIYFDSSMAHGYVAAAPGPCRMLSVCSTAEWGTAVDERSPAESLASGYRPQIVRAM